MFKGNSINGASHTLDEVLKRLAHGSGTALVLHI